MLRSSTVVLLALALAGCEWHDSVCSHGYEVTYDHSAGDRCSESWGMCSGAERTIECLDLRCRCLSGGQEIRVFHSGFCDEGRDGRAKIAYEKCAWEDLD